MGITSVGGLDVIHDVSSSGSCRLTIEFFATDLLHLVYLFQLSFILHNDGIRIVFIKINGTLRIFLSRPLDLGLEGFHLFWVLLVDLSPLLLESGKILTLKQPFLRNVVGRVTFDALNITNQKNFVPIFIQNSQAIRVLIIDNGHVHQGHFHAAFVRPVHVMA